MMLLMPNIQKNNRTSNSIYYKAKEDRFYTCPLFEYIELMRKNVYYRYEKNR